MRNDFDNDVDSNIDTSTQAKKISKRRFLKFAGSLTGAAGAVSSSVKASGVFALFQALFHTPYAETQTWKKVGNTGPAASTWQKLKLASEEKYPYTQIAADVYHSVALSADGVVFACGYNNSGQLGDNATVNKSTFVSSV